MRSPYLHLILLYIAFLSLSCDDPNSTPGVWDSGDEGAPAPFVTGIDPPDSAFAGSDEITIYGGNFGEDKDGIFVYFNTGLERGDSCRKLLDCSYSSKYYLR